jgi:hypothetical protein
MTMNKVEVEELLKVLEAIRTEKYPNIPSELIRNIVQAQFENQDDRTQGYRDTKKLIDDFLKQVVVES